MNDLTQSDLTAVYYTAGIIPEKFATTVRQQIMDSIPKDTKLITLFQDESLPRSQANIYKQVLKGAKQAETEYVALCEDDVLYSPEHFKHRPKKNHWGYNMNSWSIFTWHPEVLTQKPGGRRNLSQLICERQLLIDHLEERFRLWPDEIDIHIFGEPGKYDNQLGTTPYPSEFFYTNPPNIVFSHEANLQFKGLGKRKALGQIRAASVPYWGKAEDIVKLYC